MSDYIPPTPPTRKNKKHDRKKNPPLPENCWVDQPENLPEFSCKIELTRGLFAIVDEDDFEFLNKFTWSAKPDGRTCYAVTNVNKIEYKMHKIVMKVNNGKESMIDHINHNGVDNRKANLRITSNSENQENRRDRTKKKNRFIGVLPGLTKNFTAWIPKSDGKRLKKNFSNEVEAARYYDYMIVQLRGPDTKTNLSDGRFTKEELDSFGGKISNPLEEVEVMADINYQTDMVCLKTTDFKKIVNKLAEKEKEQKQTMEAFTENNVVRLCGQFSELTRTENKTICVADLLNYLSDKDPDADVLLESKTGGVKPMDFAYINSELDLVLVLDEPEKSINRLEEVEKERDTPASRVKLLEEILRLTEAELKSAQNSRRELADNVIGSQLSPQDK